MHLRIRRSIFCLIALTGLGACSATTGTAPSLVAVPLAEPSRPVSGEHHRRGAPGSGDAFLAEGRRPSVGALDYGRERMSAQALLDAFHSSPARGSRRSLNTAPPGSGFVSGTVADEQRDAARRGFVTRNETEDMTGATLVLGEAAGGVALLGLGVSPRDVLHAEAAGSDPGDLFGGSSGDVLEPLVSLTGEGVAAGFVRPEGQQVLLHGDDAGFLVVAEDRTAVGGAELRYGLAWMREDGQGLKKSGAGVIPGLIEGVSSQFARLAFGVPIGPWRIGTRAMLGLSRVDAEDDIVGDWSPIVTSSFALTAERGDMWVAGDRFAFVVGQPLRAEQGRARVALPAASQAEPAQRSERVEVAPQGRELRFEAAYTRPVGPGMDLTALAFVRREPGHVASADDDLGIGFRFDWQW